MSCRKLTALAAMLALDAAPALLAQEKTVLPEIPAPDQPEKPGF